ncbi:MAG: hypothetical protein ACLQVL_32955 [Terriglobia bacterium]
MKKKDDIPQLAKRAPARGRYLTRVHRKPSTLRGRSSPVAEQFQRPLDDFTGALVSAGPERLRNQPLVFGLQGDGHGHICFHAITALLVLAAVRAQL